ncbi:hypothetical protein DM02DRAFT_540946 [Periconia macrospinosa]|uniref:RING-type domain-containing protein n=1 Tax=Periconia macrospinosa TaxID=97972 RepID=A0A2V1D6M9_9PLEO|nr:hypothetical protein DM02DRAFT_540946 [Periconia macrospinosa]
MDPLGDQSAPPPTSQTFTTTTSPYAHAHSGADTNNPYLYRPSAEQQHLDFHAHALQHELFPFPHQEPTHLFTFDPSPLATTSFFDEAYRTSPTPPPLNSTFLDSILNPIESHIFGFPILNHQSRPRAPSPIVSIPTQTMPASRHDRLPNGYVDLTSSPAETSSSRAKRQNSDSGPSQKRLKRDDGTAAAAEDNNEANAIEEIDLSTDQQNVHHVLQKQREEAVKSQQKPDDKATTFNTINCVICMDTPTDLTATSCGHLFCHTCLMEALIAGENRSAPGEPKRSQCPVCRKVINRNKANDIIPLLFKQGLATQPRKKASAAAIPTTTKVTS